MDTPRTATDRLLQHHVDREPNPDKAQEKVRHLTAKIDATYRLGQTREGSNRGYRNV